ncbi:Dipeptidyl aminopeptidase BIII [Paramyrothecium foliicola]|nr:Dipeptidyl aminopeptidase BIII [Paramyrothecium foliicola]
MTIKQVAPHGDWQSPITLDSVATATRTLSSPRVSSISGRAFYAETTKDGRKIICEVKNDGPIPVLPEPYSASNKVYEYGGTIFDVLADSRIIFSNSDNTVRLLDPDTQNVSLLVKAPSHRFSSFNADSNSPWVLAIEEDHTIDIPSKIQHYIVAINTQTAELHRIVRGADFYYSPLFSYDGKKVAWLQWNHPDLPFDAAKLYVANWSPDGKVRNVTLIAGDHHEGVAEPRWGPDGSLFFSQETGNYRQLYRLRPGSKKAVAIVIKGLETAEIGEIGLFEGSRTYAPLSGQHLVASAVTDGVAKLVSIDLQNGSWQQIADPEVYSTLKFDGLARFDDYSVLAISSGVTVTETLYQWDVRGSHLCKAIRTSTDVSFPASFYSRPSPVAIRAKGASERIVHGFIWMPRNPFYTAPGNELPPLIISAHGGPTGYSGCGLSLRIQYFTSRGYAYLMLNYTGSSAHGRAYRQALFGNWGLLDVDDAAVAADFFVGEGQVREGAVGLTGLSAGGYNTLMGLTRYPSTFAGGVAVSSISDVKRWDRSTHKLESDYGSALVLPSDTEEKDKDRVWHERSALFKADRVEAPLLIIHGTADTVVALEQATLMAEELEKNGKEFALIQVKGEGHSMHQPSSIRLWLEEEEKWWRRTLL